MTAPSSTASVVRVSNATQPTVSRVGVVGGGQLALMMGEAATAAGVELTVLVLNEDDAAVASADHVILGDPRDEAALDRLARAVEVVTFDHELVDLDLVAALERRGVAVRPNAGALRFAVDKAYQRTRLAAAGLPVPRFCVAEGGDDPALRALLDSLGGAAVVKVARGGYDGRGVHFPARLDDVPAIVDELGVRVVVEERIALRGEVSQLLVRAVDGSVVRYPLVTTVQSEGLCVEVRFPADEGTSLAEEAASIASRVASLVGAVGVLAVELFVTAAGLVVNEVALRPHNTGHWTIEGAATSQFENHLRAVSGRPLGSGEPRAPYAVMVNVVGGDRPGSIGAARSVPGAFVHDYGKAWRPGRKLGHVTALGDDAAGARVTAWSGARAYGTRTREVT